jgi:hypothetical protein
MNSEDICIRIQYCNRVDPTENPNYDCSVIKNSECTNGSDDGICKCKSGFAPYYLVSDEYEELIGSTFENSATDIVCVHPAPCATGLELKNLV